MHCMPGKQIKKQVIAIFCLTGSNADKIIVTASNKINLLVAVF